MVWSRDINPNDVTALTYLRSLPLPARKQIKKDKKHAVLLKVLFTL